MNIFNQLKSQLPKLPKLSLIFIAKWSNELLLFDLLN